jgi:hypothetical protein
MRYAFSLNGFSYRIRVLNEAPESNQESAIFAIRGVRASSPFLRPSSNFPGRLEPALDKLNTFLIVRLLAFLKFER